jgi:hypothetical protein
VNELSKFFKKSSLDEIMDGRSRFSGSQGRCPNPLGKVSKYKQKFLKRITDQTNPRYAASKASSVIGGLITGLHTTKNRDRNGKLFQEEPTEPEEHYQTRTNSPNLEEEGEDSEEEKEVEGEDVDEIS